MWASQIETHSILEDRSLIASHYGDVVPRSNEMPSQSEAGCSPQAQAPSQRGEMSFRSLTLFASEMTNGRPAERGRDEGREKWG